MLCGTEIQSSLFAATKTKHYSRVILKELNRIRNLQLKEMKTNQEKKTQAHNTHAHNMVTFCGYLLFVVVAAASLPTPIINETEANGCESCVKHTQILPIAPIQLL